MLKFEKIETLTQLKQETSHILLNHYGNYDALNTLCLLVENCSNTLNFPNNICLQKQKWIQTLLQYFYGIIRLTNLADHCSYWLAPWVILNCGTGNSQAEQVQLFLNLQEYGLVCESNSNWGITKLEARAVSCNIKNIEFISRFFFQEMLTSIAQNLKVITGIMNRLNSPSMSSISTAIRSPPFFTFWASQNRSSLVSTTCLHQPAFNSEKGIWEVMMFEGGSVW